MTTPRVYVDFNSMTMDEQERVFIGREGAAQDDQGLLASLGQGAPVVLYDEEMEVAATVELVRLRDAETVWLGRPDWSTRRDLVPLQAARGGN